MANNIPHIILVITTADIFGPDLNWLKENYLDPTCIHLFNSIKKRPEDDQNKSE